VVLFQDLVEALAFVVLDQPDRGPFQDVRFTGREWR